MVIDGNRLILIIGMKILFKKNSKSELSPKKNTPGSGQSGYPGQMGHFFSGSCGSPGQAQIIRVYNTL